MLEDAGFVYARGSLEEGDLVPIQLDPCMIGGVPTLTPVMPLEMKRIVSGVYGLPPRAKDLLDMAALRPLAGEPTGR